MLKYFYFLANQTPEDAQETFTALENALQKEPDSAIAKALLGALHGNRYSLDYPAAKHSYKEMGKLVEQAALQDPNHSIIKGALIYKCFIYEEKARFFNLVDHYLSMIRNNSTRMGSVAFHLSLYGDWERGKQLLDGIYQSGIHYPLYFHGATTLYHYREKRYPEALAEANQYDIPSIFWGPMLRTAVHGKMQNKKEAEANIAQLLALKPDFEEKARYLISLFVKEDDLVEQVIEGLRQAGMELM
jgi:tetratricopeptide (TPR) repeat protein